MGANSKIEWCDHTFNPWIGCAHAVMPDGAEHPGCAHCYAETFTKRTGKAEWGPDGTRTKTSEQYWKQPIKWNRDASFRNDLGREIEQNTGQRPECYAHRPRVFCASFADVFEDWPGSIVDSQGRRLWTPRHGYVWDEPEPESAGWDFSGMRPLKMVDMRESLFHLIDETPNLDWLLLTKRPKNVRRMWRHNADISGYYSTHRKNVWLGTSISDQATMDVNAEHLLKLGDLAPILFFSVEPLLAPLDMALRNWATLPEWRGRIWVIVGGESGHGARPMHPDWVRFIRDDCQAAGVPFFFKQWGEWRPFYDRDADDPDWRSVPKESPAVCRVNVAGGNGFHGERVIYFQRTGKKAAGRLLDGREWNEFPERAEAHA